MVSPLQTNLQVVNLQRYERAFHHCQGRVEMQLALSCLLQTILQLYNLPSLLLPPCQVTLLDINLMSAPVFHLLYCNTVIFNYFTTTLKLFYFCLFLMYYLCEKYCKPFIIQYYIPDCVSWVPRLTLLNLQRNWIYEYALRTELI